MTMSLTNFLLFCFDQRERRKKNQKVIHILAAILPALMLFKKQTQHIFIGKKKHQMVWSLALGVII